MYQTNNFRDDEIERMIALLLDVSDEHYRDDSIE